VRYRIHAAAFALTAAVGPLALATAALRPADGARGASDPVVLLALPALVLAAATGVALLIELAFDVVKLRRVKRRAVPLGTVDVRRARIGTSRTVSTPTAIGYVHPAVVLPEGFRLRVDDREWDAVLAHECAHLARGDDWAKAVQSAVSRAAWWVPGLWILGRALDLERELASDELAACETGARRYAACLLRLATDRGGGSLAPAFAGRRSHVAIRVERLLRPAADGGPLRRAIALGCFTATAFAVVAAALVALPGTAIRVAGTVPQRAQIALGHHAPRRAAARIATRIRHLTPAHHSAPAVALAQAPAISAPAPERAERPAAATARPAAVVSRSASEPVRRAAPRRAPAIAAPLETIAYVAPHLRCRTCFGPLRSPDDAVAQPQAFIPPAGLPSGAPAAIVAEDPTSGPVSLSSRTIWFRIPVRALPTP
jgi:hypothetical protein